MQRSPASSVGTPAGQSSYSVTATITPPETWIACGRSRCAEGVTTQDVERVAALMARGAARFPDDGPLAWSTGATYAFELVPLYGDRPDLAQQARERGAHDNRSGRRPVDLLREDHHDGRPRILQR